MNGIESSGELLSRLASGNGARSTFGLRLLMYAMRAKKANEKDIMSKGRCGVNSAHENRIFHMATLSKLCH